MTQKRCSATDKAIMESWPSSNNGQEAQHKRFSLGLDQPLNWADAVLRRGSSEFHLTLISSRSTAA
jgi:hypothetical protein